MRPERPATKPAMSSKDCALHPLVGCDVDPVSNVLAVVLRAEYLRDSGSNVVPDETQEMQFLLTAEGATELRDALDAALRTILASVPRSQQHRPVRGGRPPPCHPARSSKTALAAVDPHR